ncbi:di-/tricarboxylate transporter [Saccharomonospora azurea NA-128]|uniref:Di-/tricarboxylate transporter n=1 Tax=Saccharomonospora azurea NA-128 TaxID=882081 RepID=H8GFT3_9PSEU|nr:di-/tricarboxylate transporter [Saccharomonospora azurea NA-128]
MSIHVIGVVALVLVFVIGTVRPVNIGALAFIATFLIGTLIAGEGSGEVLAGFPADIFVLLVGVTYLFGLASVNGTIEWIIDRAVRLFGDRPAFVPWAIFVFSAVPTTVGALGPAGVAMLAPLCLRLGERYGIDRRMTALMVMHGSCLGNFSPLNGLAIIVQRAASANGLSISSAALFFGSAAYNVGLAVIIYIFFGGRTLLRERHLRRAAVAQDLKVALGAQVSGGVDSVVGTGPAGPRRGTAVTGGDSSEGEPRPLRFDQVATIVIMLGVGVGALAFDIEIGFLALMSASALHAIFPKRFVDADKKIVWSVVLLICGITTLVGAMERYGTVETVGSAIAGLGSPLLTAFLLCLVGAVTSAFGSSAGLLGVLIPLAVPFLVMGEVGATALLIALAISATVVDSTPFSSVGALTLANAPEETRPKLLQFMLTWGIAMVVTAPIVTWLILILPSAV